MVYLFSLIHLFNQLKLSKITERKLEKQYLLLFFILLRSVIYTGNMKQGILKHTKRRVISLIKVQIVTQKQTLTLLTH